MLLILFDNHILAKVVEKDGFVWYLTGFYGWPEANEKRKSWALLSHLKSFVEGPWGCIGDFNAILHASENKVLMHLTIISWRIFELLWRIVS